MMRSNSDAAIAMKRSSLNINLFSLGLLTPDSVKVNLAVEVP